MKAGAQPTPPWSFGRDRPGGGGGKDGAKTVLVEVGRMVVSEASASANSDKCK